MVEELQEKPPRAVLTQNPVQSFDSPATQTIVPKSAEEVRFE